MEGKKKYIAIILFLLICLMVFTFATTGEEELEEGNGSNIQEVTDNGSTDSEEKNSETEEIIEEEVEANTNSNESSSNQNTTNETSNPEEEDLEGTGNTDNSAYDKALEAVKELENLLTDAQADIARDLVEEVTNSDQYKELMDRVEDAEDAIDAAKLVEELEQMVKDAAKKADITEAKDFRDEDVTDAINEIDGTNLAEVKEDLLDRIEELNKILNDETNPSIEPKEIDKTATKEDVSLTISDKNEVTTTVTKDDKTYDYVDTFTEEGTYEVKVVDAAFNESKVTFTIDKTVPKFEGLKSRDEYIEKYTVDVTDKTDTKLSLKKDHGTAVEIQEGYEITEEGTYQIFAEDAAGNKSDTWLHVDKTYPEITGVKEGKFVNKCDRAYIFDRYLTKVVIDGVSYDRKNFSHDAKNENFKFDNRMCSEGLHTVTATDKAGHTTSVTFTIDKTEPEVEVDIRKDKGITDIVANDQTALSFVIYKDGAQVHSFDSGLTSKRFSIDWLGDGNYTIDAIDAAGNKTTVSATIDHTAPEVEASYTTKTIEADKNATFSDYPTFKVEDLTNVKEELLSGSVDPTKPGEYKLVYRFTDEFDNYKDVTITINVVDTKIEFEKLELSNPKNNKFYTVTVYATEELKQPNGFVLAEPAGYVKNSVFQKGYYPEENSRIEIFTIEDLYGNKKTLEVTIPSIKETLNIELKGALEVTLFYNETFDEDDYGYTTSGYKLEEKDITVTTNNVTTKKGYDIVYTATDKYNNTRTATRKIIVLTYEQTMKLVKQRVNIAVQSEYDHDIAYAKELVKRLPDDNTEKADLMKTLTDIEEKKLLAALTKEATQKTNNYFGSGYARDLELAEKAIKALEVKDPAKAQELRDSITTFEKNWATAKNKKNIYFGSGYASDYEKAIAAIELMPEGLPKSKLLKEVNAYKKELELAAEKKAVIQKINNYESSGYASDLTKAQDAVKAADEAHKAELEAKLNETITKMQEAEAAVKEYEKNKTEENRYIAIEKVEKLIKGLYSSKLKSRVNFETASTINELQTALDNASNNEIIRISKDLSYTDKTITVGKNKNIVIDLNGKKITGNATSASASNLIKVSSGATVTLKGNGTITSTAGLPDTDWGENGSKPYPGYANNTIRNEGKLIVDGPTIINNTLKGGASYVIDNYAGSELIVEDGVIHQVGGDVAIRLFSGSATNAVKVTINGGTIIGCRAIWVQLTGNNATVAPLTEVTINGGEFTSSNPSVQPVIYSYSFGNSFANTKITINGGTFNGNVTFGGGYYGDRETVIITGGTFNGYLGRYLENDGWENIPKP